MIPMEPAQIATVAQLLAKLLADKDNPILAATRMQIMMEVTFKQQKEIIDREMQERAEVSLTMGVGAQKDTIGAHAS